MPVGQVLAVHADRVALAEREADSLVGVAEADVVVDELVELSVEADTTLTPIVCVLDWPFAEAVTVIVPKLCRLTKALELTGTVPYNVLLLELYVSHESPEMTTWRSTDADTIDALKVYEKNEPAVAFRIDGSVALNS